MNKRVIVSLICVLSLLLVGSAMADNPVAKGKWMIAGSSNAGFAVAGGDLNKPEGSDTPSYFNFSPCLAYAIAPGIFIGAAVEFDYFKQGDQKDSFWGIGPKIAWFPTAKNADEPKGKILPFLSGMFIYGQDKSDSPKNDSEFLPKVSAVNETEYKATEWFAHFAGGGVWMLSNSVGLHGNAYFELQNRKVKTFDFVDVEADGESGNEFGIEIGVTGFFGTAK